jgi:Cu+-exporting ATPase
MKCYHCGDKVVGKPVEFDERVFCCKGCKSVYQLLSENELDGFYAFNEGSGIKPEGEELAKFKPLDLPEVFDDFVDFQNEGIYIATFFLPAIHCSSCIYLLENLQKINSDIVSSEANFTARTVSITVRKPMQLSALAGLLESIGYKPELRKNTKDRQSIYDKKLLYKLGVAGFAFGSVMLWTFPEYLGMDETFEDFRDFSAYLSLLVAIPVLFYSAWDYIRSAFTAIRTKQLNLDIPIAIGILVLFIQSSSSVLMREGSGYIDSFTGFVLFLLIGKWFQSKTYRNMAFDNDPKAFFPLGVHRCTGDQATEIVVIDALQKEDVILVHNEEIIPCDAELLEEEATINTSFITGEADLIKLKKGDKAYAGSKLIGTARQMKVLNTTDRSKFAAIWNNKSQASQKQSVALEREHKLTRFFLIAVFIVAIIAAAVWMFKDPYRIPEIVTAVLVVACPCALALSFPFVYGNSMRKLGNNGLYFKSAFEIEKLKYIDQVIFDKTGTLTKDKTESVYFEGELTQEIIDMVYAGTKESTHPYSRSINSFLKDKVVNGVAIAHFEEVPGKGWNMRTTSGDELKLGSTQFLTSLFNSKSNNEITGSALAVNNELKGVFNFKSALRDGVVEALKSISLPKVILTGDNEKDKGLFASLKEEVPIHFNQSPVDKRNFIESAVKSGKRVLFLGDGLNDSEALRVSDLGISVADDVFRFTPSCDAIIEGDKIKYLPAYLQFGKYAAFVLTICMIFSLIYNIVGMTFAVLGYVTPLFAAILMPLSSITIVFLSTALIQLKKIRSS